MDLFTEHPPTDTADVPTSLPQEPTLEDELETLYQKIFDVAAQRRELKAALEAEFKSKCGFDSGPVDAAMGSDEACEKKIATELLRSMLTESARRRIGINQAVAVDTYEFHEKFMAPIESAYQKRYSYYRRSDTEKEPEIPRLDVRGAIAYLRSTYGGAQGEQIRVAQIVSKFKNELQLHRNRFEPKGGKVHIEFGVYSADWELERGSYGSGAKETLLKVAVGFIELFDHFKEPVPDALLAFKRNFRHVSPGEMHELAPALKLRTFKHHVRMTMTEGLAEKLREFITEYE